MRSDIAFSENFRSPSRPADCLTVELPIGSLNRLGRRWRGDATFASRLGSFCDYQLMTRLPRFLTPLLAGCAVTLLQVVMAVALLAPEKPITERYSALVQHDSYWFMNIIDRGYQTIVPPIDHKVMEVSNVAFFPAYPAIAALLRNAFNISTGTALLIAAQLAAWGFWTYFFLFCRRWKVARSLQICGTLLILANPAAFFLVAAYSESLFLMALLGFIYWSTAEGRTAQSAGGYARNGYVRDANCRDCVRCVSSGALGFSNRMARFAQATQMASREPGSCRFDVCGGLRRDRLFRFVPTALGSLGPLHAHAGGWLGHCARLLCSV